MSSNYSLLEYLQNMKMQSNYKPIVIKILIEIASKNNYTTSSKGIKNQIELLNFDREDFSRNNIDDSVYRALDPYVLFDGNNVSLDYNFTSDDEKKQCLQICGQKIVSWHIENNIMNQENQCYFIRAGEKGEYWEEFKINNFVAVDYLDKNNPNSAGDFDLSDLTKNEIKKRKGNTDDVTELFNISQIKKGDIIAVVNDLKTVEEFAIATSNYYYENSVKENKHRVNVEYLNFGTTQIGNGVQKGIIRDAQNKIKDFLTEDNLEYFLLRYNGKKSIPKTKEQWRDVLGEQYHFGQGVANQKAIREAGIGTKTIWYKTKNLPRFHFWGYGLVQEIRTNQDDDWNLIYSDFKYFEQQKDSIEEEEVFLKRANESIEQQIKNLPGYNQNNSIIKITKNIYQQITGEDLTPEEDELDTMTKTRFQSFIDENKEKQIRKYEKILDQSKGQIIFYGPPGTGKTYIAKQLANKITKVDLDGWKTSTHRKIVQFHPSYSYEDFVQGIKPVKYGDAINYVLQPGIFQKFCKPTVILPTMSWKTAAIYVLNKKNTPLHYKEINKISLELGIAPKDTWQLTSGHPRKTPELSQLREITEDIKNKNENSIFKKSLNDNGKEISGTYELNLESPAYEDEIGNLPEEVVDKFPKILIIDEINRGNLSKIFGELIYALEYRGEEIDLQYKEFSEGNEYGTLTVPLKDQLMIIGTMNTADRSIILFDAALRRRFSFIPLLPDYDLLAQSLDIDAEFNESKFQIMLEDLKEEDKDKKNKIRSILALHKINLKLSHNVSVGREKQIGHTFLLEMQEHPENFIKIWAQDILPLLEEYYFESSDIIEGWFGSNVYSKEKGIMEFDDEVLTKSLDELIKNNDSSSDE